MMIRNYYFISIFLVISSLSLADTTLIKNINGYTLTNLGDLINFEALKFTNDRIDAIYPSTPEGVSFVDNVIDGIITVDDQGKILSVNPRIEAIFGYRSAELVGNDAAMLAPVFRRDVFARYIQRYWRGGASMIGDDIRELEGQRSTGDVFPMEIAVSQVNSGGMQFYVGVIRDITQRKLATAEIERARRAAEEASEAKSSFLANISHEIRTPLNAIIGLTRLVLAMELTERQQDYLNDVLTASNALLGLIEDLLDFSKIEAGKLEMEEIPFRLDELFDNTATMMRARLGPKALDLKYHIDDKVPVNLIGDPLRLGQVLINLIANAIKFTSKGEVVTSVTLTASDDGRVGLRFEVKDTGIGISPEIRARLFRPFTQADASTTRKFGGTGLGLAISQRLVEMMGGTIGVFSNPGQGSRFWFTAEFDLSDAPLPVRNKRAEVPEGLHVLVVDDNEINRHIAAEMLAAEGVRVDLADSGATAVSMVRATEYDAVFMDLQMPEMDGYEATAHIRAEEKFADLPIIAMTAHAMTSERDKCLASGMNDHIAKPIDPDLLAAVLAQWGVPKGNGQAMGGQASAPEPEQTSTLANTASEGVAGIDMKSALEMLSGNEKLLHRLLGDFHAKYMDYADRIADHLSAGEFEPAERLAHSIKGVGGNIRAQRVYEAARELDDVLRRDPTGDEVAALVDSLSDALAEVQASIGRLLAET